VEGVIVGQIGPWGVVFVQVDKLTLHGCERFIAIVCVIWEGESMAAVVGEDVWGAQRLR
jgi:hypothetical protein